MPDEAHRTARWISDTLLEKTRVALLSKDFDAFAECFYLPHFIASAQDKKTLENREDLKFVFEKVTQDYAKRGVTDLIRACEVAEFRTETRIEAMHITHMMSGDQRVTDPFPCFTILEFKNGRWQATSSQYAVEKTMTVGIALSADSPNQSPNTTNVRNEK